MAGIEDLVKLYRGNSKLRSGMNFGENRGRYWTNKPDLARYWAQGGSQQQGRLIGDLLGKVKSLKIPKKIYERINPDDVWQTMIKDNNLLKKQKTDVLQTIMARAGSLSQEEEFAKLAQEEKADYGRMDKALPNQRRDI